MAIPNKIGEYLSGGLAIISSGKISDKYNNPAPPAIGRILDPSKAKFRGNQPIGQSGKRASKRYAV